jgi:uncharacterized protein YqeY
MSLQKQINDDLKEAMREGDKDTLRTLRQIKSNLSQKQKEEGGQDELDDEDVQSVLQTLVKKHRESIEEYENAGRDDLVADEQEELEILKQYLPESPDDEEIEAVIDDVIDEVGASDMRDMGDVMKTVMSRFEGVPVDGSEINQKVRNRLS